MQFAETVRVEKSQRKRDEEAKHHRKHDWRAQQSDCELKLRVATSTVGLAERQVVVRRREEARQAKQFEAIACDARLVFATVFVGRVACRDLAPSACVFECRNVDSVLISAVFCVA